MSAFGLVSIDAKNVVPIAIIAAAGIGGYYLYTRAQTNAAAAQAQQMQNNATGNYLSDIEQQALLGSLSGANGGSYTPVTQTTYSAPGSGSTTTTGSGSTTTTGSATTGIAAPISTAAPTTGSGLA